MTNMTKELIKILKTVTDPELGCDVWNLGLIYAVSFDTKSGIASLAMTFTSPNCPVADQILSDIITKIKTHPTVADVVMDIVWTPKWSESMASEEIQLEMSW